MANNQNIQNISNIRRYESTKQSANSNNGIFYKVVCHKFGALLITPGYFYTVDFCLSEMIS